jgi:hypothetical protein
MNGREVLDPATIIRKVPMTHYKTNEDYPGWYLVREVNGSRGTMHESRMRVVDNRA